MHDKPKILLVDDNPHNRLALRTILKGLDANLYEAGNGFDALTMAWADEYALILLDVQMPEMDGFEVCEQLRADNRTTHTPVIFLTAAFKDIVDKVRGYVAGATDYLEKPIEDHILKAKVQVFLQLYQQHRLLHETNESLRIAASAFESQEAMVVTDVTSRILRVNNAFVRITGFTAEEVIGKTPKVYSTQRQNAQFYAQMWRVLLSQLSWQGEVWNRRKTGEEFPCWLTISAVLDEAGNVTHYVGSFSDMTSYKQAEEEIHALAFYDPLTSLPNRRLLLDRIQLALASSNQSRRNGALMFLDLDNFKILNDTRGHDFGDQLLIEVAQRLLKACRETDTVARMGGDEFVVMLDDLDGDNDIAATQVQIVADKLLASIATPYWLNAANTTLEYICTSSIGVTLFRKNSDSVEDVLKRADVAMYQAKTAGRNAIRFFDPVMQQLIQTRSEMDLCLQKSLGKQELQLYYQIQVDEQSLPIGIESLLRWNHPSRGLVSPSDFIPLAEDTGCIVKIGAWVLETACWQLKQWENIDALKNLGISVNVSAKQFRQKDYVDKVACILKSTGANPSKLKLELTESVVLEDVHDAIHKMCMLKSLGIKLSMDDFGTGYSSLAYLQQLPMDELKIDQSFVFNLLNNQQNISIVKTIIVLAEGLNMGIIAEGVESQAQFELLKAKGCKGFQGYLFSRPVPASQFEKLIISWLKTQNK